MASILRAIIQKDYLLSVLNNQHIEIDSSWKEGEPKYVTKPEKGKLTTIIITSFFNVKTSIFRLLVALNPPVAYFSLCYTSMKKNIPFSP